MTGTSKETVERLVNDLWDYGPQAPARKAESTFRALLAEREALTAEVARLTAALNLEIEQRMHAQKAGLNMGQEVNSLTAALAQSRAETQAALAGCVKIKPLAWFEVEKYRHGGKYTAEGYTIRYIEGLFILDFAGNSKSVWRFPTLDAAKAASQADFESRILAAIHPDTSKLALVREALGNLVNHDAFQDEEYMSEDLIAKLNAARSALALITAQEEPRHD